MRNAQATVLLLAAVVGARAAMAAELAPRRLVMLGSAPAEAFVRAAQGAGLALSSNVADLGQADIVCIVTPFGDQAQARSNTVVAVTSALKAGKTLLVAAGQECRQLQELDAILPLNTWTLENRFQRYSCGAVRAAGSALATNLDLTGFHLAGRYDLHLPYANIEAGEHRYQWKAFGKDLLNTDWQVHLCCDKDGRLPLLVSGRVGGGRVFVFGADLYDADLISWSGYPGFVAGLLTAALPEPVQRTEPAGKVGIRLARHQVGGLVAEIENEGAASADVVVVYKVRNAERALLNSASKLVRVAAGARLSVPLDERSALMGPAAIPNSGDALPYRWVEVGVATADRSALLASVEALVDMYPAVTLGIDGQDIRGFEDFQSWPERQNGPGHALAGGAPIYRYVYFTGTSPALRVVLRNGLHNIAPLATAQDEGDPRNPTVQGLNDLAYSHGSIRGKLPLFGAWACTPAGTQSLALAWSAPVLAAGQGIVGRTEHRGWDRGNPTNYTLTAAPSAATVEQVVLNATNAAYAFGRHADVFAPVAMTQCRLRVSGLDPQVTGERACSLTELEIMGWPEEAAPAPVAGDLVVTATDLLARQTRTLLQESVTAAGLAEVVRQIVVPAKAEFGPVRVDATFTPEGGAPVRASFDVLFIPPDREAILAGKVLEEAGMGLLCSPGFTVFDDFGLGTQADTQGWGGDDDKTWALTHDFMELGRNVQDVPARMFTTAARFCHYTCPWRDFPSGEYFWDYAADELEAMVTTGKYKGKKTLRIFLSDRWNGVPVGATFAWADYIRFDEYLRAQGGAGLKARGRQEIAREIGAQYGDQWQIWQMNRYADKLLMVRERLARHGCDFTVTTHGSFPLAGGALGEKLAKTHKAVGTDLFWELRNEDLYYSLGMRFGVVAVNPDLESGAYNEWGWVSAVLNNPHWFAETGAVEPSRRQWTSTYFAGRITAEGRFRPYTVYGYDAQGAFGVKNTANDWQQYYRTMSLTTRLRPEQTVGCGLVVSWRWQERRMGKAAGPLGFGLYAAEGLPQVDRLAGEVYHKLVKSGVPITFVASTHTLQHWQGTSPLIVVDGYNLEKWELDELARLNRAGAAIISVGAGEGDGSPEALELFGVAKDAPTPVGGDVGFVTQRQGRGATLYCPFSGEALKGEQAAALARQILVITGAPIEVAPGIVPVPLISNDCLFLTLNDQGDVAREVSVALRPALLKADYVGERFRVMDLDRAIEVPARWAAGRLVFSVPVAGSDGRMVLIVKD